MKALLLLVLFTSSAAFAENEFASWKWGIGFTQQNLMRASTHFEVGSPALVNTPNQIGSIILALDSARSHQSEFTVGSTTSILTPKVMWEFRRPMLKEMLSYYGRLGAGYSFFSKDMDQKSGIFVIPFQLGMDFLIQQNEKGVTTFFTQVAYDLNFAKNNDQAAELNSTQITIGVRRAY